MTIAENKAYRELVQGMSKAQIKNELNSIINDSVKKAYIILDVNDMHIGDIKALSFWKRPDSGQSMMPNSSHYMFERLKQLSELWCKRCIHRDTTPADDITLHTDKEVQKEYDTNEKITNDMIMSDEYREYLRLRRKYKQFDLQ